MRIETLLREEICTELDELKGIEVGTDQYKTTVDGITKLIDKVVEIEKLNNDIEEQAESRELDKQLKLQQAKDERKDRLIKNGLTALGIVLPLAITVWGTNKSLRFEQEGTVTTIMGRGFIQKLLPKK